MNKTCLEPSRDFTEMRTLMHGRAVLTSIERCGHCQAPTRCGACFRQLKLHLVRRRPGSASLRLTRLACLACPDARAVTHERGLGVMVRTLVDTRSPMAMIMSSSTAARSLGTDRVAIEVRKK